jgi:hypothetical protein
MERLTKDTIIDSMVDADPGREEFIRETTTRLWDSGLAEWIYLSFACAQTIREAVQGKLQYGFLLDGFQGNSTVGAIGWGFWGAEDGRPLSRFLPGLQGDVTGGVVQPKMQVTVLERDPKTGSLAKAAGAPLRDAESMTFGDLQTFAKRILKAIAKKAKGKAWWRKVWGNTGATA